MRHAVQPWLVLVFQPGSLELQLALGDEQVVHCPMAVHSGLMLAPAVADKAVLTLLAHVRSCSGRNCMKAVRLVANHGPTQWHGVCHAGFPQPQPVLPQRLLVLPQPVLESHLMMACCQRSSDHAPVPNRELLSTSVADLMITPGFRRCCGLCHKKTI